MQLNNALHSLITVCDLMRNIYIYPYNLQYDLFENRPNLTRTVPFRGPYKDVLSRDMIIR